MLISVFRRFSDAASTCSTALPSYLCSFPHVLILMSATRNKLGKINMYKSTPASIIPPSIGLHDAIPTWRLCLEFILKKILLIPCPPHIAGNLGSRVAPVSMDYRRNGNMDTQFLCSRLQFGRIATAFAPVTALLGQGFENSQMQTKPTVTESHPASNISEFVLWRSSRSS